MSSLKRIRRAKHDKENPYYMAARSTAQDKGISYDALGMLNYILSKPDDWEIQPHDLEREKCGRDKVYIVLKELIKAHYVERVYHRNDKKRIIAVEYIAHEKPVDLLPEKPDMGFPDMEKPDMENPHSIQDTDSLQSTELEQNREKRARKRDSTTPHEYILEWAKVRGIDSVNIGAPIHTAKDTASAKRMARWDVPPTNEEISAAITASKAPKYAFQWLEEDIPKRRLELKPAPVQETKTEKPKGSRGPSIASQMEAKFQEWNANRERGVS